MAIQPGTDEQPKRRGVIGLWQFKGMQKHLARFDGVTVLWERLDELKQATNRELILAEYKELGEETGEWKQL